MGWVSVLIALCLDMLGWLGWSMFGLHKGTTSIALGTIDICRVTIIAYAHLI